MGVNQDFGGYSLDLSSPGLDRSNYTVLTDTYTEEGDVTVEVYTRNAESYIVYNSGGIGNAGTPTRVEPEYAPITDNYKATINTTVGAGDTFKIEIISEDPSSVTFNEFVPKVEGGAFVLSETFNGKFDNLWDVNTISNAFSSSALILPSFEHSGNFERLYELLISFKEPVLLSDLYINHRSLTWGYLDLALLDSQGNHIWLDEGSLTGQLMPYKASDYVNTYYWPEDVMVYGAGFIGIFYYF